MGDFDVGDLGPEDPTSYPAPGRAAALPGRRQRGRDPLPLRRHLLREQGRAARGNHFATVVEGVEHLQAIGEIVLWEGAQQILFEEV